MIRNQRESIVFDGFDSCKFTETKTHSEEFSNDSIVNVSD